MGDEYGPDERKALQGLFDLYDQDGSGFINDYELEAVMQKVGRDPSQAKDLLQQVDPDNNGKVSFEEFLKILSLGRERAAKQLAALQKQEKQRQNKSYRAKQIAERQ